MEIRIASCDRSTFPDILFGNLLSLCITLPSPKKSHLAFEKSEKKGKENLTIDYI